MQTLYTLSLHLTSRSAQVTHSQRCSVHRMLLTTLTTLRLTATIPARTSLGSSTLTMTTHSTSTCLLQETLYATSHIQTTQNILGLRPQDGTEATWSLMPLPLKKSLNSQNRMNFMTEESTSSTTSQVTA